MASNSDWVIPAGLDERRFCVLNVSGERKGNSKYFDKIYWCMENGGRAAMLYDLLKVDISDINLRQIPRTKALLEQIVESMTTVQSFWFDCLKTGEICDEHWPNNKKIDHVYKEYLRHCKDSGVRHRDVKQAFGRKLKKMCPGLMIKRPRSTTENGRPQHYFFPDLEQCRANFEKQINISIDWETDTDAVL
jgi:hypothetical protein